MSDIPLLPRALRSRHVTMISIGGIIGAGLFVGSGTAIASIGPAVVVSYGAAGLLVLLVMRMIAALALAHPDTGSFTEFARLAFGDWAGFAAGWLYWYFWAVVIAIEAIAGAAIVAQWIGLPVWQIGLVLMAIMTATNLLSVRSFGEFEFWFATIKILAIIAFIVVAAAFAAGLFGASPGAVQTLTGDGGFAPAGWGAVVAGVTTVIFALVGAEIVTVAAIEAPDSAALVAKLTGSLVLRIVTFYVGAILLVVAVVPWRTIQPGISPFATALTTMGIPAAAAILNVVVLVAVLSCLNSAIYVTSRVLFALAAHGDAPLWLVAVDRRGVPTRAILAGMAFGFLGVAASVVSPQLVFAFFVNASGAIILFVYLATVAAWIRLDRSRGPARVAAYGTAAAIVAVLIAMQRDAALASQLYASLACLVVVLLLYALLRRKPSRRRRDGQPRAR